MTRIVSFVGRLLFGILALSMPLTLFAAAPPALTHYQGVLRGAADEPLTGTYDMVFKFFDAATAGNEILLDRHMVLNAKAVTVDGGLFSVDLGSGLVVDGSGPGSYTSLADMFRDYAGVWLEVTIGAETLAPRTRVLATGYALNATTAETAGKLNGQPSSFYLDTSSTFQTKTGAIRFTATTPSQAVVDATAAPGSLGAIVASSSGATCKFAFGNNGTVCYGDSFGGFFQDTTYDAWTYAGFAGYGIYASGTVGVRGYGAGASASGGYFQAPETGGWGLYANGAKYGGYFATDTVSGMAGRFEQTLSSGSYVNIGWSGYAMYAHAYNGLTVWDVNDSVYSRIGASPYKIEGNGAVSFVQNHPDEPDEVVIYHAPESSEVNVYTRGSAKLTGGVAHISLDPTFEWTANPDLGLTAHLTPRGEPVALAVESVTSRELRVRGPVGSDVEFDYWVIGLRIGFEEMPSVSRKENEAAIPSKASGADVYAAQPGLRAFNALERHRAMGKQLGRGIDPDLRASASLRDRIGVGKPMVSNPSSHPHAQEPGAGPTTEVRTATGTREPDQTSLQQDSASSAEALRTPAEDLSAATQIRHRLSQFFPTSSSTEAGDVIVDDPDERGSVKKADRPGDRTVIGVALSSALNGRVEVAMASVVEVRVDASFGAILPGDLLVSSPTPGAAMLATAPEPGTILGKALESFDSGIGTIRVLVMLR